MQNAGKSFLSPVGDTRYPDDTLIKLAYLDAAACTPAAPESP
ncbi:hypothetical protein [Janthinobacterium sp. HLX7-2]